MDSDRFDYLVKVLVPLTTRRTSLGLFATGCLRLLWHGADAAAKGKKRKNRKGKRGKKDKGKPNPNPTPPCSGGACAGSFSSQADRDFCEFICRQCPFTDPGPTEFCIARGAGGPIARCCAVGQFCCDRGEGREDQCISTGLECCPDDFEFGFCTTSDHTCCPVIGCVFDLDVEECPNPCEAGMTLCGGECVDLTKNNEHCGACNNACRGSSECCNRVCIDTRIVFCCPPFRSCPHGSRCCPNACVQQGQDCP